MSLLEALLSLTADVQMQHNNEVMVTQAIERKLEPGWYPDKWQEEVHGFPSSLASLSPSASPSPSPSAPPEGTT